VGVHLWLPDPELSFVKRQGVMLMCVSLAAAAYMAQLQIPSHFSVNIQEKKTGELTKGKSHNLKMHIEYYKRS